jgi:hypothetical protein
MGLDATVYRNRKNLPAHLQERVIRDPESGEIYFRDADDEKLFDSSQFKAWHERIGNIALVAFIREEIAKAFGHQESSLSRKVVYSGSHAGDCIPFSEIDKLNREVDELERMTRSSRSPELTGFIEQLRKLIAAAIREENGIVF